MRKSYFFLFLLAFSFPIITSSQTQIGSDINGEAGGDFSGWSVSLSNDGLVVAIGASGNDGNGNDSGHVRVYENISGVWSQIGSDINGETADDWSGQSISLSSNGDIVAIGAIQNDGNGNKSGHVRVYENISEVWTQIGSDIDGEAELDRSGFSVSLSSDGSKLAIGARYNSGNGNHSGHVLVYENISGVWTQIGIDIDGEGGNGSGFSVSLSSNGNIVAIGAPFNNGNGDYSGHVRVYENIFGVWTQIGGDINGEAAGDWSGQNISLSSDGSVVAIGAPYNDGNGTDSGHVRVYGNILGVWIQIGNDIDGEKESSLSGWSVSLSADGNILTIGSQFVNDAGTFIDYNKARIYQNIDGNWTQIGVEISNEDVATYFVNPVSLSGDGHVMAVGTPTSVHVSSGYVRVYGLSLILSSDEFVLSQFSLFPNPTQSQFTIKMKEGLLLEKINIYTSLGQFINSTKDLIINTSNLSTGMYYIEVITNKGKATKQLIIE